uniref:Uncharacterized protein n=1 Tax=Micrurus surinamensis TaxID=129470 RepID=A0A2D4P264_MICSU
MAPAKKPQASHHAAACCPRPPGLPTPPRPPKTQIKFFVCSLKIRNKSGDQDGTDGKRILTFWMDCPGGQTPVLALEPPSRLRSPCLRGDFVEGIEDRPVSKAFQSRILKGQANRSFSLRMEKTACR